MIIQFVVRSSLFLVCCLLFLVSCKSDKPTPRSETEAIPLPGSNSNIVVLNEGDFQFDNATLSFLNGKTGQVTNDAFGSANGSKLGDVAQSAIVWNDRLYAVVNNSQKIEVMHASSFHSVGTITGFVSPRYVLPVSYTKAYVSDLYANAISVIDLSSLSIVKKIPCNGWTERMVYHLGKVYVTNYWQPYLYEIDPLTDIISDSILIGKGAQSIVTDNRDRLVVACGGYKTAQSDTKLVFVDPYTKSVVKTIPFSTNYPTSLTINHTEDTLYFLNTDVYKMAVNDNVIGSPLVSAGSRKFYGLGLDPHSNQLFVSDAIDYVQIGKVYVYSSTGIELAKFDAGINPNSFCFY